MGKLLATVALAVVVLLSGCVKKVEPKKDVALEAAKKEALAAAGAYMKDLKSILVAEIQKNGPESAVGVCSDTAQKFTRRYSANKGMDIRRVSFMNRNEVNIPDQSETMWLKEFENMMRDGSFNKDTSLYRVERSGNDRMLHLVKPILLAEECVVCHGSEEQIPEGIKKIIAEKYPNDKAKNFKPGDLRGAVTVRIKI